MPIVRRILPVVFLVFSFYASHASVLPAGKNDSADAKKDTAQHTDPFILKPVLGLGTGMFSYFGNVKAIHSNVQNPMTSRVGFDLVYAQTLTPAIELNLYALFGRLSVNERTPTINWNFLSEIRGGGVHLLFKILPKQSLTPYVLTGLESFEYLTKIDLRDKYGNTYYYWNDGTIRSIAQNDPSASAATPIIYRDYSYESDIRAMNLNNAGKYSLQTYAIPFGLGFMFKIGQRTDFLIGSTLHYTFTNHIDGYGDSIHSKKNDMFLMSSISLRFDLSRKKKSDTGRGGYLPESLEGVDYMALMNDDYDHDGVRDWDDSCAGTPKGVKVDARGCPIDGDGDGIPDYLDKEEATTKGAIVNGKGVALTDSAILLQYLMFMDTTGQFAQIEVQNTIAAPVGTAGRNVNYTIQLGRFSKGIPPDIMDKLLSIPDVKSTTMPDSSTIYTVGSYNDFSIAQMRQKQLQDGGLPDAKVVYKKGKDYVEAKEPVSGAKNLPTTGNNPPNNNVPVTGNNPPKDTVHVSGNNPPNNNVPVTGNNPPKDTARMTGNNPPNNNVPANNIPLPPSGGMVYRIQLGAYSHKLSRDIFTNVNDLVEVKTENGFYTYSAGSFTNYQDAVNYKTQLMTEGFPDAFIKAYKDGKRIPLKNAGATFIQPTKEDMSEQVTHETNALDKTQISFKVQVGVFRGTPPQDLANRFKTLSDLSTDRDSTGMTHYLVGSYKDFESAKNMRDKLAAEPILKDAFVVAYFKDKPMPLQQALSIMKQ